MNRKIFRLALGALLFALCSSAEAQRGKELRIAVIGAPEEPRFAEVVAGLKKGLGELGYTPPLLVLQETKIARTAEKAAKSVVERFAAAESTNLLETPCRGDRISASIYSLSPI